MIPRPFVEIVTYDLTPLSYIIYHPKCQVFNICLWWMKKEKSNKESRESTQRKKKKKSDNEINAVVDLKKN